ncbi:MAG: 2-phosphoglycerate kinase [Candidatus Marsarchaeota archaeon]|nr:2-phosphoglycerate kinase [Candidatus Marsarchaeota archaeon]
MQRNKIIFIGGVPGVGKTSISGMLAREFGIDIMLSTDYLREFVRPLVKDEDARDILSVSVYEAWRKFGEKSNENIIKGYLKQSDYICGGINAAIERAVKNGENLIIESLYFNGPLAETIKQKGVCAAYIYISDFATHTKRLNERQLYTHFNSPGQRLSAQLDVYGAIMEYSTDLAREKGIDTFDNLDFQETAKKIIDSVGRFYGNDKI